MHPEMNSRKHYRLSRKPFSPSFSEKSLFAEGARVSCVHGAKRFNFNAIGEFTFPIAFFASSAEREPFPSKNKFLDGLNASGNEFPEALLEGRLSGDILLEDRLFRETFAYLLGGGGGGGGGVGRDTGFALI